MSKHDSYLLHMNVIWWVWFKVVCTVAPHMVSVTWLLEPFVSHAWNIAISMITLV